MTRRSTLHRCLRQTIVSWINVGPKISNIKSYVPGKSEIAKPPNVRGKRELGTPR